MAVQSIDHINLRLPAATYLLTRNFYQNVLGLTVGDRPELASTGAWLYAAGRPIVHLVRLDPTDCAGTQSKGASGGLDHIALQCRHPAEVIGKLERSGIVHSIGQASPGAQTIVRVRDPSNLQLELLFLMDC